ncbi:hypothetical protein GCM10023116_22800 [Kistimonas scapharcae]|uniref:Uncharacterized protein n=1 Tax=Kistimonas scapharcae TaxID=1036133 RepID=A0ABP8V508_9GAMM
MSLGHTTPLQEQALQDYIEQHFGTMLELSSQEFSQILWLEKTENRSPDNVPGISSYPLEKEVIRLLNRLHNLALLRDGSEASYQYFTKPQRDTNYDSPVLGRHEFSVLSRWFSAKALPEERYAALRSVTIVNAVARTTQARERAQQVWDSEGRGKLPQDGMEFLWATATHKPSIYPLLDTVSPDQETLLRAAFLPDSHFRHMLYAEGSRAMYYRLLDEVNRPQNNQALSRDTFNFWFMTWLIDVSGFWVNPAIPEGSYYLNQTEAQFAITQWHLLTNALFNPSKWQTRAVAARELLKNYLSYRAKVLALDNIPMDDLLAYGGLAALMRIQTPEQADDFHQAYNRLSMEKKQALRQIYTDKLIGNPTKTPTYLPAVFVNLYEAGGSFQHSFEMFVDIYIQSMQLIKEKYKTGDLQVNKPVSFKSLANTAEIIAEMRSVSIRLEGYDIVINTELDENSITIEPISTL